MSFKRCSNCIHGDGCGPRIWETPSFGFDEKKLTMVAIEPEESTLVGKIIKRDCIQGNGTFVLEGLDSCISPFEFEAKPKLRG